MASGPITSWEIDGETVETVSDFIFLGSKIIADSDWSHEIKRCLLLAKKSYDKPRQHIKKQRHYFANKGPSSQSYSFSSSYVWMWELDYKESWALKNWCFWIVVLEKTPESPLDCNEIKPVNCKKKNQSWIFIGRTDAEAEMPILWSHDVKNRLRRRPWCWERLKAGEGDDRGWDGWMESPTRWTWVWASFVSCWWTGSLACCSPWGCKELTTTEQPNCTELKSIRGRYKAQIIWKWQEKT